MTIKVLVVVVAAVLGGAVAAGYVVLSGQSELRAKEAAREEAGRQLRSGTFDLKPGQSW